MGNYMLSILKIKARDYRSDIRGATAIVYALAMPAIIGLVAINVEMGHYRQRNAKIQSAADMAAISAALEYKQTKSHTKAELAGEVDATVNGYHASVGNIIVESPIVSGPHAGKDGALVRITQEQERYFSNIFQPKDNIVHTVEATVLIQGGQPMCMLALDPVAPSSVQVTGSADMQMESCAMHANSTSTSAFDLSGSGHITSECISASGGVTATSNYTLAKCDAPKENQPVIRDPYADLSIDAAAVASMSCNTPTYPRNGVVALSPGRYCGKSNLSPRNGLELAAPGTYYIDGISIFFRAGAEFSGPSGFADNGVTLVFMNGGHIENTNGGVIDLQAPGPESGEPFPGVLMYADRDTSDAGKIVRINGNQQARLEGALYFPTQKIDFRGGADLVSDCTQIVANQIEFSGNSALTNRDCASVGARSITGAGNSGVVLVN